MSKLAVLSAAALLALSPSARADDKGASRVVVELFTSQGCSSCPPADALLRDLSRRDDVIALSFHVDYWNYLGWRDPFSSPEATARQKDYRATLGLRYVYTPQIVIGGAVQAVGSGRDVVLQAVAAQHGRSLLSVSVIRTRPGEAVIAIGSGPRQKSPATVWAFIYDREHTTEIRRGENTGLKLINANVVRAIRRVGTWTGGASRIRMPLDGLGDGCAIVVQQGGNGPVLGAALLHLPRPS
jgi:hypothetical protein